MACGTSGHLSSKQLHRAGYNSRVKHTEGDLNRLHLNVSDYFTTAGYHKPHRQRLNSTVNPSWRHHKRPPPPARHRQHDTGNQPTSQPVSTLSIVSHVSRYHLRPRRPRTDTAASLMPHHVSNICVTSDYVTRVTLRQEDV